MSVRSTVKALPWSLTSHEQLSNCICNKALECYNLPVVSNMQLTVLLFWKVSKVLDSECYNLHVSYRNYCIVCIVKSARVLTDTFYIALFSLTNEPIALYTFSTAWDEHPHLSFLGQVQKQENYAELDDSAACQPVCYSLPAVAEVHCTDSLFLCNEEYCECQGVIICMKLVRHSNSCIVSVVRMLQLVCSL